MAQKKAKTAGNESGKRVVVTQTGSYIGRDVRVRKTLAALGLGRRGRSRELPLNEATKGMFTKVGYLLSISEMK